MSDYEVTVEDLRRTAGKYDALRDDLGSSRMPDSGLGPDRAGHIEVASWLKDVLQQAKDAQKELGKGLESLSEYLRNKARDYEQADQFSAALMKSGPWAEGGGSSLLPSTFSPGQAPGPSQQLPYTWDPNNSGGGSSLATPPSTGPKAD